MFPDIQLGHCGSVQVSYLKVGFSKTSFKTTIVKASWDVLSGFRTAILFLAFTPSLGPVQSEIFSENFLV